VFAFRWKTLGKEVPQGVLGVCARNCQLSTQKLGAQTDYLFEEIFNDKAIHVRICFLEQTSRVAALQAIVP